MSIPIWFVVLKYSKLCNVQQSCSVVSIKYYQSWCTVKYVTGYEKVCLCKSIKENYDIVAKEIERYRSL